MKNKKLLYILVPIVIMIWGAVIYKVLMYTNESPVRMQQNLITKAIKPEESTKDTYKLIANYRDPFLGNIGSFNLNSDYYGSTENFINLEEIQEELPAKKSTGLSWPDLSYGGLIYNERNKQIVGLIIIEGSEFLIKKGEVCKDIKIDQIFKDSISLVYKDENKTIYRN